MRLAAAGSLALVLWTVALLLVAAPRSAHRKRSRGGDPPVIVGGRTAEAPRPPPVASNSPASGPPLVRAPRVAALARRWLAARRLGGAAHPMRVFLVGLSYAVDFDLRPGGAVEFGQLTIRAGRVTDLQLGALAGSH